MKRALVVEDDPVWASVIGQYCKSSDLDVTIVNSPQAAMDSMDELPPDIIIADMLLATETGMALLNEMRGYDDLSNIPIIVCTSVENLTIDQLAPFGVREVINKSTMQPDDLKGALRRVLNEQR